MKKYFLIIFFIFLFLGCDEDSVSSNTYESEANESHTLHLTTQTELIVQNTNGNITVTGSDTTSSLYCFITKKVRSKISESDAQSHLSEIDITIQDNANNVKIEVDNPNDDDRDYEITLNIIIPNNFNHILTLGNGNIAVESITKNIIANLGNGNFSSDVSLQDTCFVEVAVGNGNLTLTIPDSTNALLTASVGNGNISNNGLNFQNQQISNNRFSGTLGNGVGRILLSLGNGNITMNKK
ncbi:MAG: hypothetical protein OQK57_04290 [Ignavibacteriaceae bacterium]|nr:hypothetical protein [Ignavibacteriaceae bacterium]